MAVVKGTNAGFVSEAPVADPGGTSPGSKVDNLHSAMKDTSPIGSGKITEIGFWCDNATEEANFEVGLYSHNVGEDKPATRLYVDNTNAKGTGAGWKTVVVDWEIDPETIYWIAVQVDNTATTTNTDWNTNGADRRSLGGAAATLPEIWGGGSTETAWYFAYYAVWGAGADYVELSATIAAISGMSAILTVGSIVDLSATIAAVSALSAILTVPTVFKTTNIATIKRVVVAGNDEIWFEDI